MRAGQLHSWIRRTLMAPSVGLSASGRLARKSPLPRHQNLTICVRRGVLWTSHHTPSEGGACFLADFTRASAMSSVRMMWSANA